MKAGRHPRAEARVGGYGSAFGIEVAEVPNPVRGRVDVGGVGDGRLEGVAGSYKQNQNGQGTPSAKQWARARYNESNLLKFSMTSRSGRVARAMARQTNGGCTTSPASRSHLCDLSGASGRIRPSLASRCGWPLTRVSVPRYRCRPRTEVATPGKKGLQWPGSNYRLSNGGVVVAFADGQVAARLGRGGGSRVPLEVALSKRAGWTAVARLEDAQNVVACVSGRSNAV